MPAGKTFKSLLTRREVVAGSHRNDATGHGSLPGLSFEEALLATALDALSPFMAISLPKPA
jgi:hypothetical protein